MFLMSNVKNEQMSTGNTHLFAIYYIFRVESLKKRDVPTARVSPVCVALPIL